MLTCSAHCREMGGSDSTEEASNPGDTVLGLDMLPSVGAIMRQLPSIVRYNMRSIEVSKGLICDLSNRAQRVRLRFTTSDPHKKSLKP